MRSFGGQDRSSRRLRPGLPVPGQGLEGLLYFRISADRKRLHTTNCNTSADSLPHVLSYLIPADACPGDASYVALGFNCKVTWRCGRRTIIAESARKHGVSDEDILHAYANPIRVFDLDEGFTMVIGANLAAIIYEIGVVDGVTASVIVHAMRAREKFLR